MKIACVRLTAGLFCLPRALENNFITSIPVWLKELANLRELWVTGCRGPTLSGFTLRAALVCDRAG